MPDIILMLMFVLALALWIASDPLDFEYFLKRVEPIFLKTQEGTARCYNCHSLDSNKALFYLERPGPDGTWSREQSRRNFESAVKVVDVAQPMKSRLLLHPLAQWISGGKAAGK